MIHGSGNEAHVFSNWWSLSVPAVSAFEYLCLTERADCRFGIQLQSANISLF